MNPATFACRPPYRHLFEIRFETGDGKAHWVRLQFVSDLLAINQVLTDQGVRDRAEELYSSQGWRVLSVVRMQEHEVELPAPSEPRNDDLFDRRVQRKQGTDDNTG